MSRVQSIERAFAVLSALADGPIGVTEVAQRVGVPKSTAARLLTALWHEGAVEQEAGGTRYRLGPRIADLAARHVPTRDLVGVARPHLVELATAVGEVAGLSVPDGRVVHYVDQVGTAHEVQVRDWTGSRVPMHAVPSGQVMLAGLAPAALDRFLATPLESFTPATVVDPEALRERLRDVLRDGYAWVRDEFSDSPWPIGDPELSVNRVITHYEASLLQDFPEDYEWVGSKIQIAKQIGNAVPSGLARAIARQVRTVLT